MELRAGRLRAFDQKACGAGRIKHNVLGHEQAARQALAQIGFETLEGLGIEDLGWNSALPVIFLFAPHFGHLFLIGRHPNRSAWYVFDVRRKFRTQLLPELLRIAGESKLGFGVVHHHDVAHAGGSRAASHCVAIDDCDPHALAGALFRASCTDDARSNHNHVEGEPTHRRMPMQNGSRGSRTRFASALTNAEPLMLGCTCPSRTLILPSNTLPTMLSCFHTWPSSSLPSAYRQASLALVPVPHGDRS